MPLAAQKSSNYWHNIERTLRYVPDGGDFMIVNGKVKQNRALYGGYSAFRVETGDVPEFALAFPEMGGNIHFGLICGSKSKWLNEALRIESRYHAGSRIYHITDPLLGKGDITITVLALYKTEGIILKIEGRNLPVKVQLLGVYGGASNTKFHRQGDLGVDAPDCYDLKAEYCINNKFSIDGQNFSVITGDKKSRRLLGVFPTGASLRLCSALFVGTPLDLIQSPQPIDHPYLIGSFLLKNKGTCYLTIQNVENSFLDKNLRQLFSATDSVRNQIASTLQLHTPDPFFNTLGSTLSIAADGIWQPNVWLHGAIGWRMPLCGWRAAYVGDVLGWHNRAQKHFNSYAQAQVTDVPPIYPQPMQDSVLNLCRGAERWGTPIYSNGYISRNPDSTAKKMHHYDMNLVYMDELFWHLNWTGDVAYARRMWHTIKQSLAWEKRNFDPDNDGLYDAYCCIWASDGLEYSGGAVTHSSAYNYRANKMAALIASKIGEDPKSYQEEADKTLKALNNRLWLPSAGHWAEYQDLMGNKAVHPSAGVWSIYHAIDSDVGDPFQNVEATHYLDTEIPHIPVRAVGLKDEGYATVASTNWMPYMWSTNNVAFAEVAQTALAYWESGRNNEAYKLLKSSLLDGMYLGASPGNLGQISFYDAALGESYRDFGDVIGITARTVVQGLYGILPDLLNGRVVIRPGFPSDWCQASFKTSDVDYSFQRNNRKDIYRISFHFARKANLCLQVQAVTDRIVNLKVNGIATNFKFISSAAGHPIVEIEGDSSKMNQIIEIQWGGDTLHVVKSLKDPSIRRIYDPQGFRASNRPGHHTLFVEQQQGEMTWWQPLFIDVAESQSQLDEKTIKGNTSYTPVDLSNLFNDSVTQIFKHKYLSPRPPYTSLEIPQQGIGDWCHPQAMATINDVGLRSSIDNGQIRGPQGQPFLSPARGKNILFTSLWDQYPDSITIPLSGSYRKAWLLMAGSTNQMQSRFINGTVKVYYTDGSNDVLPLINPDNWAPIEQDYYIDGAAFQINSKPAMRYLFKTGLFSSNVSATLHLPDNEISRFIDGGAGILLQMPLNANKIMQRMVVETQAYEVIIGLMALTLQK